MFLAYFVLVLSSFPIVFAQFESWRAKQLPLYLTDDVISFFSPANE